MTAERGLPSMVCFSYRFKGCGALCTGACGAGHARGNLPRLHAVFAGGRRPFFTICRAPGGTKKALTGTGALGDLGCHALDLVGFVTGKGYRRAVGHADTFVHSRRLEEGEGMGPVDVDDFCHYLMEMDGKTAANFSVTRFAYMAAATTSAWRSTAARARSSTVWT